MRQITYLTLGLLTLIAFTNQNFTNKKVTKSVETNNAVIQNVSSCEGFKRDLKILISNSFHDTTIIFRRSISNDTTLLVNYDTNQINYKIEKVLLQSKYLPDFHPKGYYSFLACLKTYDNIKEIGYFHVNILSSKAVEMRRFRIENYLIDGLICLPGVVNEFMSTEEYDSLETIPFLL